MNTLTTVIPQILAQGLLALREQCVMPRLVNSDYSVEAARKGSTIDVPIPSAITAVAVSPSNTPPVTADIQPTEVQIPLDQWYEAPFFLDDKDLMEAMNGTIPMQASEAIKALANQVNGHILEQYKGVYGFAGTAGSSPFATDTSDATNLRKTLNKQLAPLGDRRCVLDPDAEANALNLRAFQDVNFGGIPGSPEMATKMGFNWYMDQLMPTHTKGTENGAYVVTAGAKAEGLKALPVETGTGTILEGDIFTIAGHDQTYVVTADSAGGSVTLAIEPGLQQALSGGEALTFKASHVVNLGFHRDAFAFATRPLEDTVADGLGSMVMSQVDPVSQLTLRLEVTREHKRTRYSYDILWGSKLVRAELASRLAG